MISFPEGSKRSPDVHVNTAAVVPPDSHEEEEGRTGPSEPAPALTWKSVGYVIANLKFLI